MAFRIQFMAIYAVVVVSAFLLVDGKDLFDRYRYESGSGIFQQAVDVATGKRELKIKGNILDGSAEVTTSYTNEEILTFIAIGGGILLFFVCCGVCCKHCCCPRHSPTTVVYQQMPPNPSHQNLSSVTPIAYNTRNMIPMGNQAFPGAMPQVHTAGGPSLPPPYTGFSSPK